MSVTLNKQELVRKTSSLLVRTFAGFNVGTRIRWSTARSRSREQLLVSMIHSEAENPGHFCSVQANAGWITLREDIFRARILPGRVDYMKQFAPGSPFRFCRYLGIGDLQVQSGILQSESTTVEDAIMSQNTSLLNEKVSGMYCIWMMTKTKRRPDLQNRKNTKVLALHAPSQVRRGRGGLVKRKTGCTRITFSILSIDISWQWGSSLRQCNTE